MRTQWTIFARTRPDLRLAKRYRQLGGRMTLYLSVLLLLGLAGPGPGPASALQFDSFSVSAFIEPPFDGNPFPSTQVTATAPDFRLGLGFSGGDPSQLENIASIGCSSPDGLPMPCRPGDHVSAGAHTFGGIDAFASIALAGQPPASHCTLSLRPLEGTRCAEVDGAFLFWSSSTPLPPFAGAPPGHAVPNVPPDTLNLTTVSGTFSAFFDVSVWDSHLAGFPVRIDGVAFEGTGPAQFDLVWQPETGTWLPLFAEGRFDVTVTPEPATLLLFGTTGAGLGLARWYRRRGQQHAA